MNKREYIQSRLEKILRENINEKADDILNRLNYNEEAPFNPEGSSFDYVQETEHVEGSKMCESCGGEMNEGENCEECGAGYGKGNLSELGDDASDSYMGQDNDDDDAELDERLYGNQSRIDRNKNGRLDSEDFKMLRNKKTRKNIEEFNDYESDQEEGTLYEIQIERPNKFNQNKMVKESALFTESEVIEMVERIINEEKKKFKAGQQPKGYTEYERVHKTDKKEEEDYFKLLAKKMKDYLKDSTKGEYKENPTNFPESNYTLDKNAKAKKYTPSEAVDDYLDAFSYPGQTNLVYDEIKPNDEWIENNLKGSSKTGNAQVDKDGKALGNVVPSKTGDKFYKNYKDNLYGQEQQFASYKRQPQPVDQAGEETERGSLKSKRGKKTPQSVLNKVDEGLHTKESQKLTEEFDRMKLLMGYTDKTQ
tara:strand:- start:592 stop:1857 length:1266 start_codon:yes stop_codon:yes gene_type:complete